MYEEKFQIEFVAKDLEEQKKILQSKRSLQNQIPAGQFKQAFDNHNRDYMVAKHEKSQAILQKRKEDMAQLREHYNQLKFKPKTKTSTTVDESDSSDDSEKEKVERRHGSQRASRVPKSELTNMFIEEMKRKEHAKAKVAIMNSYRKQVHDLYMPKPSERKKGELEQA